MGYAGRLFGENVQAIDEVLWRAQGKSMPVRDCGSASMSRGRCLASSVLECVPLAYAMLRNSVPEREVFEGVLRVMDIARKVVREREGGRDDIELASQYIEGMAVVKMAFEEYQKRSRSSVVGRE